MPYIIIFSLLIILFILELNKIHSCRKYVPLVFIVIVLQDGLRWEMGTDWKPYLDQYNDFVKYGFSRSFDLLYDWFAYTISRISNNYNVFLIIHAILIYILYFTWIKKLIPEYFYIALFIFYTLMIGYLGMSRQHIAIAICLFSTPYLLTENYKKFIALCIIACFFHSSACLFPILGLFARRKISYKVYLILIVLSFIINNILFLRNIFEIFMNQLGEIYSAKSADYLNWDSQRTLAGFILGLSKKTIILIMIIIVRNKINWSNKTFIFSLNMYMFSILMFIAFDSNLQFLVGRLLIYYSIFECILWGFVAKTMNGTYNKTFFCLLLIIYGIITFYRSIAVYPELFIPYHTNINFLI